MQVQQPFKVDRGEQPEQSHKPVRRLESQASTPSSLWVQKASP